jgi:hypothetical protein
MSYTTETTNGDGATGKIFTMRLAPEMRRRLRAEAARRDWRVSRTADAALDYGLTILEETNVEPDAPVIKHAPRPSYLPPGSDWRENPAHIHAFRSECCDPDTQSRLSYPILFAAYEAWARRRSENPYTLWNFRRAFGAAAEEHKLRISHGVCYTLRLKASAIGEGMTCPA